MATCRLTELTFASPFPKSPTKCQHQPTQIASGVGLRQPGGRSATTLTPQGRKSRPNPRTAIENPPTWFATSCEAVATRSMWLAESSRRPLLRTAWTFPTTDQNDPRRRYYDEARGLSLCGGAVPVVPNVGAALRTPLGVSHCNGRPLTRPTH